MRRAGLGGRLPRRPCSLLLAAIAVESPTGEAAWACFATASAAHGLPRQLLSDNHLSFTGRLHGIEVAFERRLKELGVELINSAPGASADARQAGALPPHPAYPPHSVIRKVAPNGVVAYRGLGIILGKR